MIGQDVRTKQDSDTGNDTLTTWVCWASSKTTDSMYYGKHGWNKSKWHILKHGHNYLCLCGIPVHLNVQITESDEPPVALHEDNDRETCQRCLSIRGRVRLGK